MFYNNREEREEYVIELYKQGKTIREIAKEVHMSFGSIGDIIKKVKGEDDTDESREEQKDNNNVSIDTQAFKLFLEGKKPIEVAINLDVGADEIDRLYQQFWRLERLHQLTLVYQETRRYLPSFLKLFKIMKEQKMMTEQDIINSLKHAKELQSLEIRVQQLNVEIKTLENKKKESTEYLCALANQVYISENSLKECQLAMNKKYNSSTLNSIYDKGRSY
jgi:transposase